MKKSILITGIAGSGKSTIAACLKKMGHTTYDIEDIPGLYCLLDKETGEPFQNHSNESLRDVKRAKWICDTKKLQSIIANEKSDTVFYCGAASNVVDLFPLFDSVIVLIASPATLHARLSSRPAGSYGQTLEVQKWIVEEKNGLEQRLIHMGASAVDADQTPDEVVKDIVAIAKFP